jgi:hypothetical protein
MLVLSKKTKGANLPKKTRVRKSGNLPSSPFKKDDLVKIVGTERKGVIIFCDPKFAAIRFHGTSAIDFKVPVSRLEFSETTTHRYVGTWPTPLPRVTRGDMYR